MPLIPLSNGGSAVVDQEDFAHLSKWKWHRSQGGYARRTGWKVVISMHRLITTCPSGLEVDHINRDKLDNRRENLRVVNHSINQHNTPAQCDNTSGYKGVCFDKSRNRWRAATKHGGRHILIGRYATAEEADAAYRAWVAAHIPDLPEMFGRAILQAAA